MSFDERLENAGGFEQLFRRMRESGANLEEEMQLRLRADSVIFRIGGYKVLKMEKGIAELSFPFSRAITRRGGIVHGGITMHSLDTVCGLAVMTANPGTDQLTLELTVSFLRPLRRGPFLARGVVVRGGGSTAVAEGEIRDADGQLCAKSLGTFYLGAKAKK